MEVMEGNDGAGGKMARTAGRGGCERANRQPGPFSESQLLTIFHRLAVLDGA